MSKASLRFVYGSMNSAKTLRLLTMAYNFDENNQLVMNGEQILVGGNELYKPICRSCWMKLIKEKRKLNSYETSN